MQVKELNETIDNLLAIQEWEALKRAMNESLDKERKALNMFSSKEVPPMSPPNDTELNFTT